MRGEQVRVPAWVIWAVTIVALLLRLPLLNYSFYGDEGFSVIRDSLKLVTDTEDRFRPLFFSLLYIWRQLGFDGEAGLRLLPLIFGIAQVPLAYLVGKKLRDGQLGLLLAVLVAASPMLIEFSQELRMYSMVATIALAQAYVLLLMLEKFTWTRWAVFVLVALAGVYTHLLYWLFLMGVTLTFLRERKRLSIWKSWGALAATVALYLPNIPNLMRFQETRGGEYVMDFASAIPKLLAAFTVGFNYFVLGEQPAGRPIGMDDLAANLPLVLLALAAGSVIVWKLIWLHGRAEDRRILWFGHELFTVPVILATLASAVTDKYFLQPKYLIFSVPFALLFLAIAFDDLRNPRGRQVIAVLGALMVMIAQFHYWQPKNYGRKENWRTAAEVLGTAVGDSNALVLLPGHYRLLSYYAPGIEDRWELVDVQEDETSAAERLTELAADKRSIYYLRHDVVQNLRDPKDLMISVLNRTGKPLSITQLNPRFKLYRWG
ncbi:MAG: glycosyltransferase family 39 protein [Calditrichaeota bacterium]|nr:glycosyltransferase family 39 protein [Calditrichota bacterium]MCB9369694.1 glycosyltransferase family 39 protein [Calditrichota bacterium]